MDVAFKVGDSVSAAPTIVNKHIAVATKFLHGNAAKTGLGVGMLSTKPTGGLEIGMNTFYYNNVQHDTAGKAVFSQNILSPTADGPIVPSTITDLIYPIGSIYMNINSTNPNTLFGGTWVRIKDKFLLSAGDTYNGGDTGGEAKHSHEYGIQLGSYYFDTAYEGDALSGVLNYDSSDNISISQPDTGNTRLGTVGLNGSNAASSVSRSNAYHPRSVGNVSYEDSLPPYLVVYVWQRTA